MIWQCNMSKLILLDYSLLSDVLKATNWCYCNCSWWYFSNLKVWNLLVASKKNTKYLQGWILFLIDSMIWSFLSSHVSCQEN